MTEFKRKTSGKVLTNIVKKKGNINNKYKRWNKYIIRVIQKCFNKKKDKKYTKIRKIENLYRRKRKLKRDYIQIEKNNTITTNYRTDKKHINRCIEEEEKKRIRETINRNIKEIRENGGLNSNAFWDFKKRMDNEKKKNENITAMLNEKGERKRQTLKKYKIFLRTFILNYLNQI